MRDPMAEEITAKQREARRGLYSSQHNEEEDQFVEESFRKSELLRLLKTDPKFRQQVREIINSAE